MITHKKAMFHLAKAVEQSQHTHSDRAEHLAKVFHYCLQPDEKTAAPAPRKKAATKKKAAQK